MRLLACSLILIALPAFADPPRTDLHGDPLPEGALARFGTVRYRVGWQGNVPSWALSNDGKTIAIASWRCITLWDVESGRPRLRLKIPSGFLSESFVSPMSFSPDGKHFVCGEGGYLRIWDTANGKERFAIDLPEGGAPTFFPGTSEFMITAGGGKAAVYNVETGRRLREFRPESFAWMMSPAGRYLLGQAEETKLLMDAKSGRVCTHFAEMPNQSRTSIAFSPDEKHVHFVATNGRLATFDTGSGKKVSEVAAPATWDDGDERIGLSLSPDGSIAYLSTMIRDPQRRDLKSGKWLEPIPGNGGRLIPLPDGKRVLLIGLDGILRRFDLASFKELPLPDGFESNAIVEAAPDGRRFATLSAGQLKVCDVTGKALWAAANVESESLRWSADGKWLFTQHLKEVRVWDSTTGKGHVTLTPEYQPTRHGSGICVPSGQSQAIVATAGGACIEVFDLKTGTRISSVLPQVTGDPVLSPDGCTLAFQHPERVSLLDATTGKVRLVIETVPGRIVLRKPKLTFTANGLNFAGWEGDSLLVLRDAQTGERVQSVQFSKEKSRVYAVSPHALWIVVSSDDGDLELWDFASGKKLRQWDGHYDYIQSIAFADSGRVVTNSGDLTALLWDLRPKEKPTKPLWDGLVGDDPVEAYRAVWAIAADPGGPALLRSHIAPAPAVPPEQLTQRLAELGADRFAVREDATKHLEELGRRVDRELREAQKSTKSEEVRSRLERLIAKLTGRLTPTERIHAQAVTAMEIAGTPEAKMLLAEWARGAAEARLTIDAKAALGRMSR